MTNQYLLDALAEYLEKLYANIPLKNANGELAKLTVYKTEMPEDKESDDADGALSKVPYCIVKVLNGTISAWNTKGDANVIITFCTYDDSADRQGYRDFYNLCDRLTTALQKNNIVGGKFEAVPPIEWAICDEDTYPLYLGAISLKFKTPEVVIENDLA